MSLSSVGSINATKAVAATEAARSTSTGGGAMPFGVGTTSAGGYIAQGAGTPEAGSSLVKKMLTGAVVGAGAGFAASFFNPVVALATSVVGPVGWAAKGVIIAAGAAIGAAGGLAAHFISKRRQNLAMQAQAQNAQPGGMQPTPMPTPGTTLRSGARGPAAAKLQKDLKALGVFTGKLTGSFDSATQQAVRKYEVMKGVVPTGQGSPDVRAAIAQDAALAKQYV